MTAYFFDHITIKQASRLFGKERSVILRACQEKKVKAEKVGNQWMIDRRSAFDRWGKGKENDKCQLLTNR